MAITFLAHFESHTFSGEWDVGARAKAEARKAQIVANKEIELERQQQGLEKEKLELSHKTGPSCSKLTMSLVNDSLKL